GNDTLSGDAGTDTASFAGAVVGITASLTTGTATGDGTDTLSGFENLTGSSNADALTGDGNANTLTGGDGNDTLEGLGGADSLIGGNGTDTASYQSASAAVTVDFSNTANNTGDAAGDTYNSIENITGSNFADRITGTDSAVSPATPTLSIQGLGGNDTILGGNSANTIDGGAGNDLIYSGGGDDTLTGGSGTDTFYFASVLDGTNAITDF
ncbi:unnamed protein product, partial [Laminaria digitata]